MRRPLIPIAAILAVIVLVAPALSYDEPPLASYTRPTPNKAFVFVMLHHPRAGEKDSVRAKYPTSGLYRADDPATAMWVYPDEYVREAYPASDGVHLVVQHLRVISPDPRTCGNSPPEPPANPTVLTVYAGGKKVRDVRFGELLDHVRFARENGPGWHSWLQSARIDDAAGTFVVETVGGRTTRLDLATGYSVNGATGHPEAGPVEVHESAVRRLWGIALGVGLLLVAVAGITVLSIVLFRSRPTPLSVE